MNKCQTQIVWTKIEIFEIIRANIQTKGRCIKHFFLEIYNLITLYQIYIYIKSQFFLQHLKLNLFQNFNYLNEGKRFFSHISYSHLSNFEIFLIFLQNCTVKDKTIRNI